MVHGAGPGALGRLDSANREVRRFPLPARRRNANLNTATFDGRGVLWFTGQAGVYERLDPGADRWGELRLPGWSPEPYAVGAESAADKLVVARD